MKFSLLLFAILALALTAAAFPKIDSRVFEDTENGKTGSFSIHLRSKANLSGLRGLKDKKSLGWKVLSNLKETAESSQADLLSWLRENKEVERVAPFYIANFIIVDAKRPVIEALAKRRDIKAINANRPFKVSLEVEKSETVYSRAKANEWNLDYVNAPLVWEKYGTTGTGIYANADTGVEYTHEALLPNYKGNSNGTLNHNFNWWDGVKQNAIPGAGPCGVNSQVPCDDNNHGSHTTGTSVGQNGIGVAPGAKWIACRNMDRGYGSVESYLSCLQFFLAPTDLKGSNPNPELRPLAIGNSYGCVSSEGCSGDEFTEAVEALRAAGIFMSVSAGNSGPSCNTITDPPATEPSVISVGATAYQSDGIASFSSRGPVRNAKKPTVVAPGSAVRSAVRGGGYSSFSGTSMASPHIGGYVNLIVAICPELAYDVDALEQLLISTTKPLYTSQGCGGDTAATSPNNVFGYGILDIEAAAARCVGERK